MTLTIELIGIVILLLWCVVPIREFAHILRGIRARNAGAAPAAPPPGEPHP
jgi:hypothetical protein